MRLYLVIFIIFIRITAFGSEIFNKLNTVKNLMNQTNINSEVLEPIKKTTRYIEDRKLIEMVQKDKRFFTDPRWKVRHAFYTLFLTYADQVVITMDFSDVSNSVIINGSKIQFTFNKSIKSQVDTLFKSNKTASGIYPLLLNRAYAASKESNISNEEKFIALTLIATTNPKLKIDRFTQEYPSENRTITIEKINDKKISSNQRLTCKDKNTTGTLKLSVLDAEIPLNFDTKFEGTGDQTKLTINLNIENGKSPMSKVITLGKRKDLIEMACHHNYLEVQNGKLTLKNSSVESSDASTGSEGPDMDSLNSLISSINDVIDTGQVPYDQLIIACLNQKKSNKMNANDFLKCLTNMCVKPSEERTPTKNFITPYYLDKVRTDKGFNYSALADKKIFGDSYSSKSSSQHLRDIVSHEAKVIKARQQIHTKLLKALNGNSFPESCNDVAKECSLPDELLKKDEMKAVRIEYSSYNQFNQIYKNSQATFNNALENVFNVIEAAASCCLNSNCANEYNEMIKSTNSPYGTNNSNKESRPATQ